ncbi:MAG: hypothetical protein LBQ69_04785 [Treponema sp.]|nr:hypothetical protein [Treponema sp.]
MAGVFATMRRYGKQQVRKLVFIAVFFINPVIYPQEADENTDDSYHDFGAAGSITVYGDRALDPESIDAYVVNQLNGSRSERRRFIERDFLEKSGFRRTGNAKFRRTTAGESAQAVLHELTRLMTLGLAPVRKLPLGEMEYGVLPRGNHYPFEQVLARSTFHGVSPEVSTLLKLEYMLHIGFSDGLVYQDSIQYYTDSNINQFGELIASLPDYPESIRSAKTRYANELLRIKAALERYRNPSENYTRARHNLRF